jgi:hypothetical protein
MSATLASKPQRTTAPGARAGNSQPLVQVRSISRGEWLFRLVVLLLLGGSVALTSWVFKMKLAPAQQQSREMSAKVSAVLAAVDELDRQWDRQRTDSINSRADKAKKFLFDDQVSLENWLANLREQADPLFLEAKTDFGKTVPQKTDEQEIAVIPATISVSLLPTSDRDTKESAYQRVVRFSTRLMREDKRADIAEIHVQSGMGSIKRAVLVFNLWAGDEG